LYSELSTRSLTESTTVFLSFTISLIKRNDSLNLFLSVHYRLQVQFFFHIHNSFLIVFECINQNSCRVWLYLLEVIKYCVASVNVKYFVVKDPFLMKWIETNVPPYLDRSNLLLQVPLNPIIIDYIFVFELQKWRINH
jgi:hypothetical protein